MKRLSSCFARGALALAMLAMAGCATRSESSSSSGANTAAAPQAAATPVPYVENCAETNCGSPSKFVCNGKSYTSFQLAKIREDEAKKLSGGK
jgi:hypothetical protein